MIDPTIRLEIPSIDPKSGERWTDKTWDVVFSCIEAAGLWGDFQYESALGSGKFARVVSLEEASHAAPLWKSGNHTFTQTQGKDALALHLNIGVPPNDYRLHYSAGLSVLGDMRGVFLDQAVAFIQCLYSHLHNDNRFGLGMCVWVDNLPYARSRPPRRDHRIRASALLDAIPTDYAEANNPERTARIQTLISTPLPDGVVRTATDGLLIIRWITDLSDERLMAERMTIREQWLNAILQPPIESDYNERGDRQIYALGLLPHPPLTLYEPGFARGFKAIYVDTQGSVDQRELDQLRAYLEQGSLPDQTPLKELYLIAPDRDRAIMLYERVRGQGFNAVYYPGGEGVFCDPFPPGLWLEEGKTTL